jgi:flagellar basal-body rod protein FlgF
MNYGNQISISGVLTALHRQDVASNNLANINTVGFKPQLALTRQRDGVRIEDGVTALPSDALIERLGAGVLLAPSLTTCSQGTLTTTGNDLDVAIEGDGFLLVREASDGSADRVRLTRDGRLARNAEGLLVQAASGLPVLDRSNREIEIADAPISIAEDGAIVQNGAKVATLGFYDVSDRASLRRMGEGLYLAGANDTASRTLATGRIRHRTLESSAVDEIDALMDVTSAARDVSANLGMVQYQDRLMDRAINTLGRVA